MDTQQIYIAIAIVALGVIAGVLVFTKKMRRGLGFRGWRGWRLGL